ncbi:MAG: lactonase family protein [Isosphaeraceae bacterium]
MKPLFSYRLVVGALMFVLCASLASPRRAFSGEEATGKIAAYVGTYTGEGSKGIYRFELDRSTGKPNTARLVAELSSPSFLAIDPRHRFLYAVNEVDAYKGQPGGAVSAFAVDARTGDLTFLNTQSTGGSGPCHLVVDRTGKNVLVANYGGGSVAVLPIQPDGHLKPRSSFVQHQGSSVDPARQQEPHAHSVNLDSSGRFAFVADLGLDKVLIYRFDPRQGKIAPNDPPAADLPPGSGPRHFAFHPGGRFAYAINELNSTVTGWSYDPELGKLSEPRSVSTLPAAGFQGENYPAEVQVHPSGKFLYGSNRGHHSIVVYSIDQETGQLTYVENESQGIKTPRGFAIDPSGAFLLVANQDSDTIVIFRIDPSTGKLTPTGHSVKVARPVCVKFCEPAH